jgi:hypothetical protein
VDFSITAKMIRYVHTKFSVRCSGCDTKTFRVLLIGSEEVRVCGICVCDLFLKSQEELNKDTEGK